MIAKCSKCEAVFETPWRLTQIHVGNLKYLKCPACGKKSLMQTGVKDPVTWLPGGAMVEENKPVGESEQLEKRIEESRYERPGM